MIIFLQGSDSLLAKQAITSLRSRYRERNKGAVEYLEFDGETERPNWADLHAVPLLSRARLIIIRRAGLLPEREQASLAAYLANLPTSTVAVVWDSAPLKSASPLATVLTKAQTQVSVQPLSGVKLKTWLTTEMKRRGIPDSPQLVASLVDQFGNDLWALSNELERLRLGGAVSGERSPSAPVAPPSYFSLVKRRNWHQIAQQLRVDVEAGSPLTKMIGLLGAAIGRQLDERELKQKLIDGLLSLDIALKTGLIDESDALLLLTNHLPNNFESQVQWEKVWAEIYY